MAKIYSSTQVVWILLYLLYLVLFYFNGALVSTFEAPIHIHFHYIGVFHVFFKNSHFVFHKRRKVMTYRLWNDVKVSKYWHFWVKWSFSQGKKATLKRQVQSDHRAHLTTVHDLLFQSFWFPPPFTSFGLMSHFHMSHFVVWKQVSIWLELPLDCK